MKAWPVGLLLLVWIASTVVVSAFIGVMAGIAIAVARWFL